MFHRQKVGPISFAIGICLVLTLALATRVSAQSDQIGRKTQLFLPFVSQQENFPGQTDTHVGGQDYIIIEGDIQVPKDFFSVMASSPHATFNTQFWPNGTVPFEFDGNVTPANQALMLAAMAEWENVATVNFQPCNSNLCSGDYVHIQDSAGNDSAVGKQGGEQVINIIDWNLRFRMAHELAHTLGFWHEQSRTDRDTFVEIISENIETDQQSNFALQKTSNHYGPYDFDSVMHYGSCYFSTSSSTCPNTATAPSGGQTIIVRAPYSSTWGAQIGQRDHLSAMDRLTMSFLYPQTNWRFADMSYNGTQTGAFLMPYQAFTQGLTQTPVGGTLWVQPGAYAAAGTYNKAMTIQAPLGDVTLGK